VARPAQTEGPYFVEEALNRSDIRVDPSDGSVKPGTPLELTLLIARLGRAGCAPLAGARVDVWHSDHLGVYSDVTDPGGSTVGRKFLRGYQLTDGDGRVRFLTVYPGAYQGRTVHIHFKVRAPQGQRPGYEFTSQLYFDDALTDDLRLLHGELLENREHQFLLAQHAGVLDLERFGECDQIGRSLAFEFL